MAWALWLGIGLLLALIEIAVANSIFLMLSAAAIAAAFASFHLQIVGQFLTAVITAFLLLLLARPWLERYRSRVVIKPQSLLNSVGTALDEISEQHGLARINGEVWSARSIDGPIQHGTQIVVIRVEGTTTIVRASSL